MLALAAAFAMLLLLFHGLTAPDDAVAQAGDAVAQATDKKSDVESLVAAGDSVKGKGAAKGDTSQGPAAMPRTGPEVEKPLTLGLVLLLDGALAFLITSRRRAHADTAT